MATLINTGVIQLEYIRPFLFNFWMLTGNDPKRHTTVWE